MQSNDPRVQTFGAAIADLLRAEREKQGLSKYEVAQRSGLSDQAILYVESKRRIPSIITLYAICKAMSLPLWKIIKEAEKIAKEQSV